MTSAQPIMYVSLKGGTSGGSGSGPDPINNVAAINSDGTINQTLVLNPDSSGCPQLDELRGLWLLPDGTLYVCDAQKGISKILLFDGGSAGLQRAYVQTVATYDASSMPALQHPYGVATYGGNLYVSAQDSNYVSWYTVEDGSATPNDPCHYLHHTLGGTYPAGAFVGCTTPPKGTNWTSVKKSDGGLGSDGGSSGGGSTDAKQATQQHSVRGFAFDTVAGLLYVADEANDRVTVFDAVKGTYKHHIEHKHLKAPVGIAIPAGGGSVYIGSAKANKVLLYEASSGDVSTVGDDVESPSGIAVAADGTLYVASRKGCAIKVLDTKTGTFVDFTTTALKDEPECIVLLSA